MITVSEGWKEAHKARLLPETFIEISYSVTEPGLQEDASATANLEENYSETASIISSVTVNREKYSSLEQNLWGLDGSFTYYDETPVNPGYVAFSLSGEDTVFEAQPTITIHFSAVHTELIPGITITWAEKLNEWASSFRIRAYNGSVLVAETVVEDTKIHTLEETSPHHNSRHRAPFYHT